MLDVSCVILDVTCIMMDVTYVMLDVTCVMLDVTFVMLDVTWVMLVVTAVNVFSCSFCEKTYKTKGDLNRHVNKKHTGSVADSLHCITLLNLISKSIQTLSEDLCLSLERRYSFSTYIYPEEWLPLLLEEVNKLYSELVIDSNAGSFDSAYFSGIVFSADTYFKNLPERSSTMLAINLGENRSKTKFCPSLKKKMMH